VASNAPKVDTVCGIGFDIDHTLAIDNRLERVAFLHLLSVILTDGGRTVGTIGDEIDSIDELLAQERRGDFSIDDAVRRFAAKRCVEPTNRYVETFRRRAVEMVDEFVVPLPGVKPMLEALRERGIAVAALSNGWNPLQARKAERAGFRGPILVSSEIGEQKPSPLAFEVLVRTLGTQPAQTWYVGDCPHDDVAAARAAGIQGVWIDWEHKEYPASLEPPTYTIANLEELLNFLPAPARAP
jgi:HAD superfamily hydrolase (TIGR01509 family)